MTLRIGIVGCGAIARDMHAPAAVATPQVQLAAAIDNDLTLARNLAQRFNIPHVGSRIADAAGVIDAVLIATPPHTHVEMSRQAFAVGLHVLCEKPMANTAEECDEMVRMAAESGHTLAVGHNFRFFPVRRKLRQLMLRHDLGEIESIVATEGKPYTWPTLTGYTVRRDMVPGGVILNAGIHTLDSILWWMGDPEAVEYEDDAVGGLESNARVSMHFGGGRQATFRQSRTCTLPYEIHVVGQRGQIMIPTNSPNEYMLKTRDRITALQADAGDITDHACEQLQDFARSVTEGRPPLVSGTEGARVIRLIDQLYATKRARALPLRAPTPGLTW
jgi:predicted dehydrogenase